LEEGLSGIIIYCIKVLGEKQHVMKDPCLFIQGQLSFQYVVPCNFYFHLQVAWVIMLSKANGLLGSEIEPTTRLETSTKFSIFKSSTSS
jgi:hypothetical protein